MNIFNVDFAIGKSTVAIVKTQNNIQLSYINSAIPS